MTPSPRSPFSPFAPAAPAGPAGPCGPGAPCLASAARTAAESRFLVTVPRLRSFPVIEPFWICLPVMSWAAVAVVAPTASATSAHATMVFRIFPSLVLDVLSLRSAVSIDQDHGAAWTVHRNPVG